MAACEGGWKTCSGARFGGCVLTVKPTPEADSGQPDATAEACAPPPVSTQALGVSCEVLTTACDCATGVRYRCLGAGGARQPSTAVVNGGKGVPGGCVTLSDDANRVTEHCCAAACVRHSTGDAQCEPGHPNAYSCAPGVDAGVFCVAVAGGVCCGE